MTDNFNLGYYTTGMPSVTSLIGSEKIPLDVPNSNGVNPASGFTYSGAFRGGGIPLTTGRFYGATPGATPGTFLTVTATLYAYPFFIPNSASIVTTGLYTTSGQTAGAGHAGIYADNGSGYPGALIQDTGALICTSGAAIQNFTPTVPLVLTPGWYWLASIFTASGTFPTVASNAVGYGASTNSILGSDTAAHLIATSAEAASGLSVAGTYGALPATFTAGATLRLNLDTPMVILGT